jgi:anti-sigma factor RsiW
MPVPSDLENGVQLRLVRRRAIAVAMLYVAAAAAFLLAAMPPSSVPGAASADVAMSQGN